MEKYSIADVKIIQLPKQLDPRGNLSIIEAKKQIPFDIKRVYWLYDVPGGCERGGHAYKENVEFVVALSGSFDLMLDDGTTQHTYLLNRSYYGILIPQGLWRVMSNFSTNSLALVLSSTDYNAEDYIMNYKDFLLWKKI